MSQQNSPRRSLIPQPTYRQRSTSLTKAGERSPSPKIGRRVDSKTRLNVSDSRGRLNAADSKTRLNDSKTRLNDSKTHLNKFDSRSRTNLTETKTRFISNSTSNLNNNSTTMRRQPTTKGSTRLSPIQGTPTKPEKTTPRSNIRGKDATRQSPTKTSRTPQKNNAAATRRDGQNRSPSKDRLLSPSKIPLKTNTTNGSSNTNRFISMPEKNVGKTDRIIKEGRSDKQTSGQSESSSKENGTDGNFSGNADDSALIDLLKQTSQVTGTSSERLVNTTTTTAVQPLHIDANTLLVERNEGPTNQQKERSDGTVRSSVSPTSKGESPVPISTSKAALTGQKSSPLIENQQAVRASQGINPGNDKKDSPVGAEGSTAGHSKSGSVGQSTKNIKINDEGSAHQRSSNQSSANQRSGKSNQNARWPRPSDGKVSEEPEVASVGSTEVKSGSAGSKTTANRDVPANDKMPTVMENDSKVKATEKAEKTMNNATAMSNNATNNVAKSNNNVSNPAVGAVNVGVNSDAVVRTRNENHGSDASLKSSTCVSTDSIESVRSTDTGVSVNTVRGVSSPREKTGVHTVKRSQEIETLSGNIVRVEQNGEPA